MVVTNSTAVVYEDDRPAPAAYLKGEHMEGVINPLAVRDPWRCGACGNEWLVYESDEAAEAPRCPRCDSAEIAPIGS
jgi:hypothetical protein